ncbi:MAG: hypothetical protein JJU19_17555 [Pararhodobacter sp.]|nr:hypothetical protein [Pararhodobacter sp.]
MPRYALALTVGLLALPGAASAQPHDLSGLCLDAGQAGCMPRYLPFDGLSIDFCEETCTLGNPVTVRGLAARLYDMTCLADYPDPPGGRVLILRQSGPDGRARLWFIDQAESREIVPCPRG